MANDLVKGRFPNVSCSQCGGEFGPGDHGFSHCSNHKNARLLTRLANSSDALAHTAADVIRQQDAEIRRLIDSLRGAAETCEDIGDSWRNRYTGSADYNAGGCHGALDCAAALREPRADPKGTT